MLARTIEIIGESPLGALCDLSIQCEVCISCICFLSEVFDMIFKYLWLLMELEEKSQFEGKR